MVSVVKTYSRFILAISITALVPALRADDFLKLQNTSALNTAAAWQNGFVPGVNDYMVWNNLYTTPGALATLSQLGGDMSVLGIKVTDVGGTRNVNSVAVGFQNTGSANTLTIGAGGIDMSTALQALRLQSKIQIGANQTWQITNANTNTTPAGGFNNGEDLCFDSLLAGAAFDLGGNTVDVVGNGAITVSSGFTIRNGIFGVSIPNFTIQSGGNRASTIEATATFNIAAGGRVHLQSNSGAMTSAATINLNGGTLTFSPSSTTNAVTQSGNINVLAASTIAVSKTNTNNGSTGPLNFTGGLTGSAALTINNDQPAAVVNRLVLSGDNSAYSGALTLTGLAGKATRFASATAGSAAASWNVATGHTLELNGVSVSLGSLSGAGTVRNIVAATTSVISVGAGAVDGTLIDGTGTLALTKVGSGTLALNGANSYSGPTTVSAGTLAFRAGGGASFGISPVSVADGAGVSVNVAAPGGVATLPSLTVGTSAAGRVAFDLGSSGNPLVAPLRVPTFSAFSGTQIIISGAGFTNGVAFPILDYDTSIGGGGFAGLSLVMPPRVAGLLSDDATTTELKLTVNGTDAPKWTGAVDGNWDIDGTPGTLNWREIVSGTATRYIQTGTGSDSVRFDDSATGLTDITIATSMTPSAVVFENTARIYSLGGPGNIAGSTSVVKSGTAVVRFTNTTANTYTGGTLINEGVIELGDGVTIGAGSLGTGAITNNGVFRINRPDGYTVLSAISGTGNIALMGGNLTVAGAAGTFGGTVDIGVTRRLTVSNAMTISGAVSGSGSLLKDGAGQLVLASAGTYTGGTTVTGGTLLVQASGAAGTGPIAIGTAGRLLLEPGVTLANAVTVNANSPGVGLGAIQVNGVAVGNVVLGGSVTITGAMANGGHIVGTSLTGTDALVFGGPLIFNGVTDVSVRTGRVAFAGGGDLPSNGVGSLVVTGFARVDANDGAPIEAVLNLAPSGAATFDLNGFNQTFALLRKNNANAGVVTNTSLTPSVLTLDTPAVIAAPPLGTQTEGFGGTVTGNLSLVKNGAGTQSFVAGSVASFSGGLTVNAGVLDLQGSVSYAGATTISAGVLRTSTAQTGTSSITIGSAGRLLVRIANAGGALATGGLTTSAGSRIDFDLGAFGNPTVAPINAPALSSGASTQLTIIGATTAGVFPLIAYDNINPIGGAGFAGFVLSLPLRVAGNLVDNAAAGTIDVNIAGIDNPKWKGDISSLWDINDGSGTGTLNWRGTLTGSATHYFQNAPGTDHVLFDDSATSGSVSLTTTLTPLSVTINNPVLTYAFNGAGRISGATSIVKSGAGTLILANAGANDFTGGIVINEGRVEIGDGATVGTGTFGSGAILNNGTLVFNRPGDFTLANAISGTGALEKRQSGTLTVPAATTLAVPLAASEGTIAFVAGATLTGPLSGAGAIQFGAASQIGGTDPNTFTGELTILAGDLQLNKPAGVNATGNVINITGTGRLLRLAADQIPDTATINFTGTSTDSITTQTGAETVGNIIVNSANAGATGGQVIMRSGLVVAGTGTVSRGILGVASGSTATVNAINITATDTTSAILRVAGGGAASTLNIGPGGITASGGDIQVKFSTTNQDAIINLGGDFTSTGNVIFTNAGYTGVNLNVINLVGDRTFNIGAGTLTTVAPDFGGSGGLIKAGDGTLTLNASSVAGHTGGTTVLAGVLELNGSITGSVALNGGTLSGIGSVSGAPALVDFNAGARISPGPTGGIGTMTFGSSEVDFADGSTAIASASLLFDIGDPFLSDRISLPSGALNIGSGVLEFDDFVFTTQPGFADQLVYTLVETSQPIAGSFGANRFGTVGGFPAQITFADSGTDIVLIIPEPGSVALLLGGLGLLAVRRRRS